MAKIRIRNFSLEMKDGNKVEKDIAELREHFDWERVLVYFHDGRLQRWLKINGYREEADKVADLQEGETFVANLCEILGVDVPNEEAVDADPEDIKNKSARLRRLRQYTTDEKILALVENVAFTQEEMEELIDEAAEEVVLCDAQFKIPLRERGIKYYGAGRAVAVIESETVVDFAARHIEFHKIVFDKKYQQIVDAAQKQEAQAKAEEERRQAEEKRRAEEEKRQKEEAAKRLQEEEERRHAQEMQNRQKMRQAQEYYERGDARCVQLFEELAAEGDIDAMGALFGWYTEDDKGKDDAKAFFWARKLADAGDLDVIGILGMFYEEGTGTQKDLQKAFDCYRRAAEQNDVWAMRNLARCYENGVGVDSDKKRAAEWYMKAAEAGDVFAMLRTGDDLQGSEQYAKAHEWYEKAAAAEDESAKGWALDRLGMMYRNGLFGEGHEVTAVRYFEQADEAGCAMGTYHLAECYDFGLGVVRHEKKAAVAYQKAAEAGIVDAMEALAMCYLFGEGVEEDEETAFVWYRKAADQGSAFSMTMMGSYFRDHERYSEAYDWYQKAVDTGEGASDKGKALDKIGEMYLHGDLGEGKESMAVRYFEQASELGYASGTLHLAQCYDNGWGVVEDVKRAFTYYLKTVEDAGDTDKSEKGEALNRLGVMYLNGDLGENDDATAAQYFAQAADVDHAWGTANLAKCYKNGWGVVLDQNRAKKLWKRAMELGDESMKQELQQEMQQKLQQETPQTEQRQISAAEVLAELLGVIMSGNLFGGVHLWYWHYPVDVSGFTFRPWSRSKMRDFLEKQGGTMPDEGFFEEDEKVLGGIVLKPRQKKKEEKKNTWESLLSPRNLIPGANLIASAVELGAKMLFDTPATMVFTDAAVYFEGMCIPYGMIENVVERKGRDNCTVVRMRVSGEKEPIDLPLMNYKGIDTAAVQLFLVAAMNFDAAERKQGLTHSEQERLAKIKLVTLRDDCILDYL